MKLGWRIVCAAINLYLPAKVLFTYSNRIIIKMKCFTIIVGIDSIEQTMNIALFDRLPCDLKLLVWEFDPNLRVRYNAVIGELANYWDEGICESEACEADIYISKSTMCMVLGEPSYFCNKKCASYGKWSMEYDYRKHQQRMRLQAGVA
jgi:hypothetical protein